ncbi:SDR family oxidoreductase [Oceanobacillus halophilus]|uniref:3-beta hydroxysteroid dehydrogenase n=1 Tax=Oceanobacillus halophilus TaxID=930130 RepID=A0A495A2V8_9BACI|nr:SDR family oxidoreductase [Oceanobacillus halophilus]RKQ33865.1 3-beta hydroxysteroid dehydrogenase [Oceanobacillus halophilus]
MQTYFITGYPGFLARNLLQQLIKDHRSTIEHIYLLVLPKLKEQAEKERMYFSKTERFDDEKITIVEGDITEEKLAINKQIQAELQQNVTHVFHLAAVYDLAVPETLAYQVNVKGTDNVNKWLRTLFHLERYIYFSTAYISGTREGNIFENELNENQSFRNHYEKTKFKAEILVDKLKTSIPTTIIRPGIVKGHSKTGETIKFDGMYFLLNLFDRIGSLPIIPYLGEGNVEGNFVPSDYVLMATSYLAIDKIGEGKTYHVTDPNAYTMREIYKMVCEAYLGKTPKGIVSKSVASLPLYSKLVRKWIRIEKEAMDYFIIDSSYDTTQTITDLEGSGIECPDLKDTIEPMINFYRRYKHDYKRHIQIS